MTKFKVVRYWDTYPDGVVATCDTEEEAEKICKEYLKKRKPMYDYLVRKEGELCHREYYTSRVLPESLCEDILATDWEEVER